MKNKLKQILKENEIQLNENVQVFSAVSCMTRQKILQMLAEEERHVSSLARELKIAVPVASKHIKVLEEAGLVQRKIYGRTHVFSLKNKKLNDAFNSFAPTKKLEVKKGTTLMDAFRSVAVVEIKNIDGKNFVVATDGEEGYYIYEVNGKLVDKKAENFLLEEDAVIEWKRLEPVTKKKLIISIKKEDENENSN